MDNKSDKLQIPVNMTEPQINKYHVAMDKLEPLCIESVNRFVLFPFNRQQVCRMYKQHVASFWTVEEIDLSLDRNDWQKLKPEEQHFIKYVLAFFAASDGIVLGNLTTNFINDIKLPEARCFYTWHMENIHSNIFIINRYIYTV